MSPGPVVRPEAGGPVGTAGGWGWRQRAQPDTTTAGAEHAMVLFVIGIRLGTLVQGLPSMSSGIAHSPEPALYAACWVAAAGAAVGVSVASFRRGRGLPDRVQLADMVLAVVVLLLGPLTVATDYRIGTWEGFQPGYALSVALSIAVVRGRVLWALGAVAIVLAHFVYVSDALDTASLSTTVGNISTVVILAIVGRIGALYLRRMASDADEARARAAELARREEEQRAQVAIHNGAVVMHLLGDPDLDEATRARLLEQAPVEATRMRAYLRGVPRSDLEAERAGPLRAGTAAGTVGMPLDVVVDRKCREFDDLAIEAALELGEGVHVDPAVADAVENALTSLLLNVRMHARARQVVVHLDAGDEQPATGWTLTVHDDGRGFDASGAELGVGLREVVVGELGRHGVDVRLESAAGEGTTITMAGAALAAPAHAQARQEGR